ncbi:MAG: hypothetical protein HYU41_10810 [Candidatus Rokubacteria bacterium]|nr:hypothetical protein [Candidatus Rokubacteria bacterium]
MSPLVLAILAVSLITLAALAVAVLRWERHRSSTAAAIREAIVAELERDPALTGLTFGLHTRTEWSGETIVEVNGVVTSPWYRYAIARAIERILSRSFQRAHMVDRIVVARQLSQRRAS